MPRGDRTGPNGMGPMTGRAAGYCTGNDRPGFANWGYGGYGGYGYGRGGGYGRGYRNRFFSGGPYGRPYYGGWGPAAPVEYSPEQERDMRKKDIEMMEAELKAAKDRLAALEKETD